MQGHRGRAAAGFTLVELMVVVGVIGILAAVALPAYREYVKRAELVEAFVLSEPAQRAVGEYYDRWGRLPAHNRAAGLAPPEDYQGRLVRAVRVDGGMVVVDVDMSAGREKSKQLHRLYLQPGILRARPTAALVWSCGGQYSSDSRFEFIGQPGDDQVPERIRPTVCRAER